MDTRLSQPRAVIKTLLWVLLPLSSGPQWRRARKSLLAVTPTPPARVAAMPA